MKSQYTNEASTWSDPSPTRSDRITSAPSFCVLQSAGSCRPSTGPDDPPALPPTLVPDSPVPFDPPTPASPGPPLPPVLPPHAARTRAIATPSVERCLHHENSEVPFS